MVLFQNKMVQVPTSGPCVPWHGATDTNQVEPKEKMTEQEDKTLKEERIKKEEEVD